jgi:diguanylate cyclase (GGDEF)-like protein/PAS domain S-box-containing protein
MKHYGIERQTLFVAMIPILVMAVLLDSYFITTRFSDLERSFLERSQLLTRQLASSCEYAVFSGNTILLKQNMDAASTLQDVKSIAILDDKFKPMLETDGSTNQSSFNESIKSLPVYQDGKILRVYEPIMATQINLDGLLASTSVARQLGSVVIELGRSRLNKQKEEILLLSLLSTMLVFIIAMILAFQAARRINKPILQMHQAIRRIAAGELETNVAAQSDIHELHELIDGINDMSRQLLRDRDMLETRIVQATDGLREKKEEIELASLERDRLNEKLAKTLGELQAIMEANPDILYVFNTKNKLVQWNSNFAKFFRLSPDKLLNMSMTEFVYKADRGLAIKGMSDVYANGSATMELQLVRHDGVLVPYLCNGVVLKNIHGEVTGFTGTGRDISERKAAAEHIHHLAHYDMLTDLPNRSLLSDRLQQAIMICKRERTNLALMFLDLDMFKFVNDKFGHDIGDVLLKEAAVRIQTCLRESDTAARIGGDEFVVLLPSIDSAQTALLVAEKIRQALSQPFEIDGHSLRISSSIGIAIYPEHGSDEKTLLKNADTAMYMAKQKGRNAAIFFPVQGLVVRSTKTKT